MIALALSLLLAQADVTEVYVNGKNKPAQFKQLPQSCSGSVAWSSSAKTFSCNAGSGGAWTPANVPASPHSWDVEFDSDTLPSGWTIDTANSVGDIDLYATLSTAGKIRHSLDSFRPGWLMFQINNGGVFKSIVERTGLTLPTNLFIYSRISYSAKRGSTLATTNNQGNISLGLNDGTANNTIVLHINESDTSGYEAQFEETDATVFTAVNTLRTDSNENIHMYEYMGIQKLGTTYHGWLGASNGTYFYMGSHTVAASMTVVAVRAADASSAGPGSTLMGTDFIRFNESANFLP